jgi:hypothetical protein
VKFHFQECPLVGGEGKVVDATPVPEQRAASYNGSIFKSVRLGQLGDHPRRLLSEREVAIRCSPISWPTYQYTSIPPLQCRYMRRWAMGGENTDTGCTFASSKPIPICCGRSTVRLWSHHHRHWVTILGGKEEHTESGVVMDSSLRVPPLCPLVFFGAAASRSSLFPSVVLHSFSILLLWWWLHWVGCGEQQRNNLILQNTLSPTMLDLGTKLSEPETKPTTCQ